MGIAEIIPGISGGTIAFITGIYQELLDTIKAIDLSLFKLLLQGRFADFWNKINGNFLLFLFGGMVLGVGVGVFGVSYLFENYPEPLWGFFFGLIIASSIYIANQITKWSAVQIALMIAGAILSYYITTISPADGSDNLLYVFFAGMIAICALILPGISGSFILLLMGMYMVVIPTLKNFLTDQSFDDFILLAVFGSGCLVGLALFSRVLSYTFANYKNATLAALTGFIIGSLNKIWPWRHITEVLDKDSGEITKTEYFDPSKLMENDSLKVLVEENVLPPGYYGDTRMLGVVLCFLLGLAIVWLMSRYGKNED